MTLRINGEDRAGVQAATVAELVAELGLPAQVILVEHNDVALRRAEWAESLLQEGDRLEMIRIVAGG